jgi:acyl dehydratase
MFTKLSGDKSCIHTNESFCNKTRFKRPIGYGFLLNVFLSKLYGEYLPGGSSICIKQESKFINPFYVGDVLTIKAHVKNKVEATRFVEIETQILNQDGKCVFKGNGLVQVLFYNEPACDK